MLPSRERLNLADELRGARRLPIAPKARMVILNGMHEVASRDCEVQVRAKKLRTRLKNARYYLKIRANPSMRKNRDGYNAAWRNANPDKMRAYRAAYKRAHPEWVRKYQREWLRRQRAALQMNSP